MKHAFLSRPFRALSAALLALALTGCTNRMTFTARADRSTDIAIDLSLGEAITRTLRSVSGTDAAQPLLSAQLLTDTFGGSDVTGLSASNPDASSLSVSGTIPAPEDQRHVMAGTVTAAALVEPGNRSLSVRLSPRTLRQVAAALPETTRLYVDLLMAPVFTQEAMTAADYATLLGAVYGKEIADELSAAQMELVLNPPRGTRIATAPGAAQVSAGKARFSLPLMELLTLTQEKTFTITW